ncbi:MAG: P-II family nitrogen regulator [Magnetovibrionaceae bacterium]
MKLHKATRISIIAEKLLHDGVCRIIMESGAKGYSVFDGGGGMGSHGCHSPHAPAHAPAVVGDFAIVKIESVVAKREVAEEIAAKVADVYFSRYSGIVYLEDVDVLRPEKF